MFIYSGRGSASEMIKSNLFYGRGCGRPNLENDQNISWGSSQRVKPFHILKEPA